MKISIFFLQLYLCSMRQSCILYHHGHFRAEQTFPLFTHTTFSGKQNFKEAGDKKKIIKIKEYLSTNQLLLFKVVK